MSALLQIRQLATAAELACAHQIRRAVFVEEQGIPSELEYDTADATAIHLLGYVDTLPVATARLVPLSVTEAAVSRVAVLSPYRGNGYGRRLVQQIEVIANRQLLQRLVLHPHHYLEEFYAALGYVTLPDSTLHVAGHHLITMQKYLR